MNEEIKALREEIAKLRERLALVEAKVGPWTTAAPIPSHIMQNMWGKTWVPPSPYSLSARVAD